MNRTLIRVAFGMAIMAVCTTLNSCQTLQNLAANENVKNVVTTLLTNYVQGQGATTIYNGTLQSQLLKKKDSSYFTVNSKGDFASQTANITVIAGQMATITVPAQTVDGATMSQVALGNLNIAKNGTASTITVGDNTTANGTLTVNGTSYNITGAFLDGCTYTEAGTIEAGLIQFYFGTNQEYVASFKFKGKKQ